jgi:hypothetical protein
MPFKIISPISPTIAFNNDGFPDHQRSNRTVNQSPAKTSPKPPRGQRLRKQAFGNGFA